jgi:hypothetical protein
MTETKGSYIHGGDGAHFPGCENVHWDCKIKALEGELAEANKLVGETELALAFCQADRAFFTERSKKANTDLEAAHLRIAELTEQNDRFLKWHAEQGTTITGLRARIAELEAERQWVPVGDRLPEKDGQYLVHSPELSAEDGNVWICTFIGDNDGEIYWSTAFNITHWRPKPEPPK